MAMRLIYFSSIPLQEILLFLDYRVNYLYLGVQNAIQPIAVACGSILRKSSILTTTASRLVTEKLEPSITVQGIFYCKTLV